MLVREIRKFPNPLTSKRMWESLSKVYILYLENELIGVCGIYELRNFIKLGPFVVLQRYHHQGFGRKIFQEIVNDYFESSLFIGSRNPAVAKLAITLGFFEEKNILKMPLDIHLYLITNLIQNLSLGYLKEVIRKNPTKEGPYRFFFKRTEKRTSGTTSY